MRAVCQRVSEARVRVADATVGEIGPGLCILLGIARGDEEADGDRLAGKVARLRLFPDDQDRFDRSLLDTGGAALVVSQFTLIADTSKGNRPSFTDGARRLRGANGGRARERRPGDDRARPRRPALGVRASRGGELRERSPHHSGLEPHSLVAGVLNAPQVLRRHQAGMARRGTVGLGHASTVRAQRRARHSPCRVSLR